jgi:hypothetical protein
MIEIIGKRYISGCIAKVREQVAAGDQNVRLAAVRTLATIGSAPDFKLVLDYFVKSDDKAGSKEAVNTLNVLADKVKGKPASADICAQLVKAVESVDSIRKQVLMQILSKTGHESGLQLVRKMLGGSDSEKDQAVRAVAEWSDKKALPVLLDVARSDNLKHHVLAVRGFTRIVDESNESASRKLGEYKKLSGIVRRPDEKRLVIAGLGRIADAGSIRMLGQYLDDKALQADAVRAISSILLSPQPKGKKKGRKNKGSAGSRVNVGNPELAAIVRRAAGLAKDQKTRADLGKLAGKPVKPTPTPAPETDEGFVQLFNGKDLSGWTGAAKNRKTYRVENGVLICDKGKGLFRTEKEYSDFILRFEFKLTPGANNGLGIRMPAQGNAAYEAMELQILDDTADKYKKLKDYQYHGSIYGVVAAKRGFLKPVGEWNKQEVTAKGSKITVKLNGEIIVDADLTKVKPLDNKKHPGLKRTKGYISLCGHNTYVEFKNMKIKDLSKKTE